MQATNGRWPTLRSYEAVFDATQKHLVLDVNMKEIRNICLEAEIGSRFGMDARPVWVQ